MGKFSNVIMGGEVTRWSINQPRSLDHLSNESPQVREALGGRGDGSQFPKEEYLEKKN